MKKLKKLSLTTLSSESIVLSVQQQMEIYAGVGIDGLCYFEGLAILSGIFNCNYSEMYYVNNYAATHGGYGAIFDASLHLKGVEASSAVSYLTTQFTASSIGIGGFSSALASGQKIMTDLNQGNGVSHAVIITGYNSSTGMYTYQDANGTGTASASQLNTSFSMAVSSGIPH